MITTDKQNEISAPPAAQKQPVATTIHGKTLIDEYAWLREKEAPEVTAYLEAENAYTASVMAPLAPLEAKLYSEMLSHIQETDVSVPYRDGDWYYYSRTTQGLQYGIHCRIPAASVTSLAALAEAVQTSSPAGEQVTLDVNELAAGQAFMAVGTATVSNDGNLLAYTTDNTGFRQYTLHVKDLRTGETLTDTAERVGSVAWAADDVTLFYTVEDEATKRQHRLYRHTLGTPQSEDTLVYEEPDERFNIGLGTSRDGKYLILESASHTTSEQHFLAAATPTEAFQLIEPRRDDIEYYVDHREDQFFIRTNDTGRNFRLVSAPVAAPGSANWQEVLPHDPQVMLEDFDVFQTFYGVSERASGLLRLRIFDYLGSEPRTISFPEPAYTALPSVNREFTSTTYRYSYQSLVTPGSAYEYDTLTGTSILLRQQVVPGGFDRALYTSERIFATASDGERIPISLVYRKDAFTSGKNPLYIYGYGSYGYPLPIGFNPNRLSLLDRGLVIAYAHIRGGGDMGKPWHDAGRLMVKRNTFTDFVAVTEHLLAAGYGAPGRVAIEGGSAGGLLMGAVTNLRPDLFRAVLSHVPFVDVMNTMLDATLPLTVPEYEEWGNPNEPEAFEYMLSYSPYENLRPGNYPSILVKTSLHDSQVMYWEPAKYVARLRTLKTDDNPLLLHTNMQAGHGGASGRYDYLKEIAFDYAFLLWQLGVESA